MFEKKQRSQTFWTYLLLSAYAGLAVIFVMFIFLMPKWMERFEFNYVDKMQVEIIDIIENTPTKDLSKEIQALRQNEPFEIVIYNEKDLVYRSLPGAEFRGIFGKLNSRALLFENQGDIEGKETTLQLWFGIYRPPVGDYIASISTYQFLLVMIAFLLILSIVFISNRSLIQSLKQVKHTVANLKDFRFEEIVESDETPEDAINAEMFIFTKSLQGNISAVSQNYTDLEYSLQLEKERLASMMMISRGFIHDFKTPMHQMLLEISDHETTDEATRALLQTQMDNLEHFIEDINEALQVVSTDSQDLLELGDEFDLVNLFKDIRVSLQVYLEKRNLWLDAEMPETLPVKFNKVVARLIIHNLLTNALKYAEGEHDIRFEMYAEPDGTVKIYSENTATNENINRIQNSEDLFSAMPDAKPTKDDYAYSSGQGLYLIKNLVRMNGGTYNMYINDNIVTIEIILPNIAVEELI